MAYEFDHVHLKSADPGATADWYVKAFNFKIVSDAVRTYGDRFVRCETPDGIVVNISGARTDEKMGDGDAGAHWGLEHFGIKVDDMNAEIERRCETPDGIVVNISGARTDEKMGDGDAGAHWGLEHFGIKVDDMNAEIERLTGLGAELMEGPIDVPNGPLITFIKAPVDVRIELLQWDR